MASLGELFVELGVVGDVKPLEKAIGTMKEAVKQINDEIAANKRLLKYLQDIKNARNNNEKAVIKENFAKEIQKQKMLDEIDQTQKAVKEEKELSENIGGVIRGLVGFAGAVVGATFALNKLVTSLVESNQQMLNLMRTSDIGLRTFQKWNNVGKMLGVQNAAQQLEGLNQRLFELRLTGEGARGFQLAGINPMGQDANGVMEQLRNRVQGLDDTSASYLLQQMGIDPQMLHLLRLSRNEFEALGQTIRKYQLTPEQSQQIQAMNIQLQIAAIKLQYLKDRAILAIIPGFIKLMNSLVRVTEGLKQFVKYAGIFISQHPSIRAGILNIATALGVLFAILHPILTLLSALYLLIDDIVGYNQGKKSLVGGFLYNWNKVVDDIKEQFEDLSFPEIVIKVGELIIDAGKAIIKKVDEKLNLPQKLADLGLIYIAKHSDKYDAKEINRLLQMRGLGTLEDYNQGSNLVTPSMQQNISNNKVQNHSNVVNQDIKIQTNQPAEATKREYERAYIQARFATGM